MPEPVVTEIQISSAQMEAALARVEMAYAHLGDRAVAAEARAQAAFERTVQTLNGLPQSVDRVQASYDRLRASLDPVFSAQLRGEQEMTRSLATINRAVLLNITTEQQAAKDIAAIRAKQVADLERVRTAQDHLNDTVRVGANDNSAQFRRTNLGYQGFDVAQGLASGTPLAIIAAQQGPQIAQMYAAQGGLNALWADASALLSGLVRAAGPWVAILASIYGAYKLIMSYSAESALGIDDVTAALAKQAAPIGTVKSMIADLYSVQKDYTKAISATATAQTSATATIIANSEKEFNAKKSLLELELKRQQALIASQQAEMAIAGLQLKGEVGQRVFTRSDTERQGFSDPRIGSVPFVRLPDDITGLEKTRDVLDKSPLNDKIKELRANIALTEVGTKALDDALKTTFDATTVKPEKLSAAAKGYRDLVKNADDRLEQMRLEIDLAGKVGIAAETQRYELKLLNDATDHGRSINEKQRQAIHAIAVEYGELAEKLAKVKLARDLAFDHDQLLRSPIDQEIASMQRSAGLPIDLNSAEAGMVRLNAQISTSRDAWRSFGDSASDALVNLVTGTGSWRDALASLIPVAKDLIIQLLKAQAIGAGGSGDFSFGGLLSGLFGGGGGGGSSFNPFQDVFASARGNVLSGPGISAYSSTIVSQPTLFPFAKGMGLMGEAGEEGILPLRRNSAGQLGVMAANQNRNSPIVQILDMRSGGAAIEQDETTGPDGEQLIRFLVKDEIRRSGVGSVTQHAKNHSAALKRRMIK